MAFIASETNKTHIMEGCQVFDASHSILASSNDAFLQFLTKKVESITNNDDAQARTLMVQKDPWLSAIFDCFHREAVGFSVRDKLPLYVTMAEEFKRVECEVCQDFFTCSRSYEGRHLTCVPCEENTVTNKLKSYDQEGHSAASKRASMKLVTTEQVPLARTLPPARTRSRRLLLQHHDQYVQV